MGFFIIYRFVILTQSEQIYVGLSQNLGGACIRIEIHVSTRHVYHWLTWIIIIVIITDTSMGIGVC